MGKRRFSRFVHVDGQVFAPGDEVPDGVGDKFNMPVFEGDAPAADSGADSGSTGGYDDLKVVELKAEIDKRNEGRPEDAQVSKTGNKADLVAALEADDAQVSKTGNKADLVAALEADDAASES